MTDARFPERWLNDRRVLRLSSDAFRLYVFALAWSVANKTDGVLHDQDLALMPAQRADVTALANELWISGLWARDGGLWQITDFEETQTTADDLTALSNARRRQRDKMRRRRAAAAGTGTGTGTVPGHVPGHSSGNSTRTGQARPGAPKGSSEPQLCTGPGCTSPPRNGFRTCRGHAVFEPLS
jgi:hypothetical protein